MSKVNRREFLTFAGIAPLGLAMPSFASNMFDPTKFPNDYFDPWLEININNLAHNVSQTRKRVSNKPIMAVVKCNGYGHGVAGISKALSKNGIEQFAIVKVYEGIAMREANVKGMILNFGPFSSFEAEQVIENNISQSVFSDEVQKLVVAARKLNKKAKVHIKVDTGLGRVGVPHNKALEFIEKVAAMPEIIIEGIFTTLTEEIDFDKVQVQRLVDISEQAKRKGISVGLKHAASSLAIANSTDTYLDMVRPGNCLYGIEKLPNLDLRQVMSLKTRVIYIKEMHPGDTVSYHRKYKIKKDTLLATLPLGYSDGYPNESVGKGFVLINGKRYPLVAYMSANHVTVDITGSDDIKIGDEVMVIGSQGNESISIADVAEWGKSSVYKVPIKMNPLLPRIYVDK